MAIDIRKHSGAQSGQIGPTYLARGTHLAMRLWDEPAGEADRPHTRSYETIGYVLQGQLELTIQGEKTTLVAGDTWIVPAGAEHAYRVLEPVRAIEATSPPSCDNQRDAPGED